MAAPKKKGSLVDNINARKKAGMSRPTSRSTVSSKSYEAMEEGWSGQSAKKAAAEKRPAAKKKRASKKASAKKASGAKKSAGAKK